jgi:hypothetical protein
MTVSMIRTLCRAATLTVFLMACQLLAQLAPQSSPPCATPTATCDDIPPNLLSVSYPTGTVDAQTENLNGTFAVTATALDPFSGTELTPPQLAGVASGVSYAYIQFASSPCSSNSATTAYAYAELYPPSTTYYPPPGTFIPGQTQNLAGTLYFDVPYPPMGAYTFYACSASIVDNVGNSQYYSLYGGQTSLLLRDLSPIPVTVSQ